MTIYNSLSQPMGSRRTLATALSVSLLMGGLAVVQAHDAAEEMAEAANHLLVTLAPEQQAKAVFPLKDGERFNWHFIPRERKGLALKEMTPDQRHLAYGLLSSGLSQRGFLKATTIMSLEQLLKDAEQGKGPVRDPERYFFSFFGQPEAKGTWGWRMEGHHLSLNFMLVDGRIAATPSFFGSNPGEVRQGPRRGLRVLGAEEDLGRQLVKSLSAEQYQSALLAATAPADIVTGTNRQVKPLVPAGLSLARMTEPQQQRLKQLLHEYVFRYRPEVAEQDLRKLQKAGMEKVHFGWAGGMEPGQGHYYRIQGPTFLMEYDNTQNHANHIHTVWRDFDNDFGDDLLREHYQQSPHRP